MHDLAGRSILARAKNSSAKPRSASSELVRTRAALDPLLPGGFSLFLASSRAKKAILFGPDQQMADPRITQLHKKSERPFHRRSSCSKGHSVTDAACMGLGIHHSVWCPFTVGIRTELIRSVCGPKRRPHSQSIEKVFSFGALSLTATRRVMAPLCATGASKWQTRAINGAFQGFSSRRPQNHYGEVQGKESWEDRSQFQMQRYRLRLTLGRHSHRMLRRQA